MDGWMNDNSKELEANIGIKKKQAKKRKCGSVKKNIGNYETKEKRLNTVTSIENNKLWFVQKEMMKNYCRKVMKINFQMNDKIEQCYVNDVR